jgi:hypothetical protein
VCAYVCVCVCARAYTRMIRDSFTTGGRERAATVQVMITVTVAVIHSHTHGHTESRPRSQSRSQSRVHGQTPSLLNPPATVTVLHYSYNMAMNKHSTVTATV